MAAGLKKKKEEEGGGQEQGGRKEKRREKEDKEKEREWQRGEIFGVFRTILMLRSRHSCPCMQTADQPDAPSEEVREEDSVRVALSADAGGLQHSCVAQLGLDTVRVKVPWLLDVIGFDAPKYGWNNASVNEKQQRVKTAKQDWPWEINPPHHPRQICE